MEYFSPTTLDDCLSLLSKYGDKSVPLAGSTFFMAHREELYSDVEAIIDIKRLGLNYIRLDKEGLKIGATTTLTQLVTSEPTGKGMFQVLSEAAAQISPNEIRNMGTVGGGVCISAELDLPTLLIALDAKVAIASTRGSRILPVADLYLGYLATALQPDEIVTEIQIASFLLRTGAAFHKLKRTAVDMPIVNAAAKATLRPGGRCSQLRLVLGGIAPTPIRAEAAEKLLTDQKWDRDVVVRAAESAAGIETVTDVRATAEQRKRWAVVAARTVLHEAYQRAGGEAA